MVDPIGLGWAVERDAKLRFEAIAAKANVSAAVLFEMAVDNLPLTDQGIPSWMPPLTRDGELPIDSA